MPEQNAKSSHIVWHPAFIEAIKMELEAYEDVLEFHSEYQLASEPLRIDCLVIKKAKNIVIKKNIAAIFRDVNLIEYKSPTDHVSLNDFYKVYGYACIYSTSEKVPMDDLTVTFIGSRHPRKLLKHLEKKRKYIIDKTSPGIYSVQGDVLPIQIIDSRYISAEENIWLKSLSDRLNPLDFNRIGDEADKKGNLARIARYLDVITQANPEATEEALEMRRKNGIITFKQALENAGWAADWESNKAFSIAQNMVKMGLPFETVVSATQLDAEKVKALYPQS